jgi:hypothetical protein
MILFDDWQSISPSGAIVGLQRPRMAASLSKRSAVLRACAFALRRPRGPPLAG